MISIILGSKSDMEIGQEIVDVLDEFGVENELKVISAHRAMDILSDYVKADKADVYIGVAGMAAHLAGAIAGMTSRPVIGVPCKSKNLDGLDALLSTVQMPPGVPVATVAINGGKNAGLLATQILANSDEDLARKLKEYREEMKESFR